MSFIRGGGATANTIRRKRVYSIVYALRQATLYTVAPKASKRSDLKTASTGSTGTLHFRKPLGAVKLMDEHLNKSDKLHQDSSKIARNRHIDRNNFLSDHQLTASEEFASVSPAAFVTPRNKSDSTTLRMKRAETMNVTKIELTKREQSLHEANTRIYKATRFGRIAGCIGTVGKETGIMPFCEKDTSCRGVESINDDCTLDDLRNKIEGEEKQKVRVQKNGRSRCFFASPKASSIPRNTRRHSGISAPNTSSSHASRMATMTPSGPSGCNEERVYSRGMKRRRAMGILDVPGLTSVYKIKKCDATNANVAAATTTTTSSTSTSTGTSVVLSCDTNIIDCEYSNGACCSADPSPSLTSLASMIGAQMESSFRGSFNGSFNGSLNACRFPLSPFHLSMPLSRGVSNGSVNDSFPSPTKEPLEVSLTRGFTASLNDSLSFPSPAEAEKESSFRGSFNGSLNGSSPAEAEKESCLFNTILENEQRDTDENCPNKAISIKEHSPQINNLLARSRSHRNPNSPKYTESCMGPSPKSPNFIFAKEYSANCNSNIEGSSGHELDLFSFSFFDDDWEAGETTDGDSLLTHCW